MKKVDLVQNSTEWEEYRKTGLGASDFPVIMGVSPYSTRLALYSEKIGEPVEKKSNNFIMSLGHKFEPQVRARLEIETSIEFDPEVVEMEDFPWLRASLDACSFEHGIFAEIKYMGKKNFDLVKATNEPLEHHMPQVQGQFMVTGFEKGLYIPYTLNKEKTDIEDFLYVEVSVNKNYIERHLFPELKRFWDCVVNRIPPAI